MKAARANFFNTPPEPVRLDPWKMFDMGNKKEDNGKKEEMIQNGTDSEDSEEEVM